MSSHKFFTTSLFIILQNSKRKLPPRMMMSTTEPQSIIHHALRFERRIVRAVTNMNRRRRLQKAAAALALPRSILLKNTPSTDDDLSVHTAPDSIMSTSAHSAQPDDEEYYVTINQNDFMSDCMMNSTGECIFVHFFIRDSSITKTLDMHMQSLATMHSNSTFVRIDAKLAPFVTSKLQISNEQPAVIAMKNGSVVNRISDFSSAECEELKIWASTIELLRLYQ
jgi:hypothetical protein